MAPIQTEVGRNVFTRYLSSLNKEGTMACVGITNLFFSTSRLRTFLLTTEKRFRQN